MTPNQLYKIKWRVNRTLSERMANLLDGTERVMYGRLTELDVDRYHAHDLNDEELRHVRKHLAECDACAQRSARMLTACQNLLACACRIAREEARAAAKGRPPPPNKAGRTDRTAVPTCGWPSSGTGSASSCPSGT